MTRLTTVGRGDSTSTGYGSLLRRYWPGPRSATRPLAPNRAQSSSVAKVNEVVAPHRHSGKTRTACDGDARCASSPSTQRPNGRSPHWSPGVAAGEILHFLVACPCNPTWSCRVAARASCESVHLCQARDFPHLGSPRTPKTLLWRRWAKQCTFSSRWPEEGGAFFGPGHDNRSWRSTSWDHTTVLPSIGGGRVACEMGLAPSGIRAPIRGFQRNAPQPRKAVR
jgi:hypothetical protein